MKRFLALFLSGLMLMSCAVYGSEEDAIHRFINLENDDEVKDALEALYEDTFKEKSDFELVLLTSVCIAELYNRGLDKNQDFTDMSNSVTEYVMKYAASKKEEEQEQSWEKYLEENQQQSQSPQQVSDDYIRPEIKEAIDSYVDFFKSFADFMNSYDNGTNPDYLKYIEFLAQYAETMSKFQALENSDDLTTAESLYYANAAIEIQKIIVNKIN